MGASTCTVARALAGAGVLALCLGAFADGTIVTTGAAIGSGAAPLRGIVTVDACRRSGAPPTVPGHVPVEEIGQTLGLFGGGAPGGFPGAGTGADGAFSASSDVTLPGGIYDYTSFSVSSDAVVTYTDAVVLNVIGDVDLAGVVGATPGPAVTIRCGGNLTVLGGPGTRSFRGIRGASVAIDVVGDFLLGDALDPTTGAAIVATRGSIKIVGHGASSRFVVGNGVIANGEPMVVRSAGAMTITGPQSDVSGFGERGSRVGMRVQALGGALTVTDGAKVEVFCDEGDGEGGCITLGFVEASGSVTFSRGAALQGGPASVSAFGGDVDFDGAAISGTIDVRASRAVTVRNGATLGGRLGFYAFGGDVTMQTPDGSAPVAVVGFQLDDIILWASRDVNFGGACSLDLLYDASLHVDAGRAIVVSGPGAVSLTSGRGMVELRAGERISVSREDGLDVTLRARRLVVAAGPAGADLGSASLTSVKEPAFALVPQGGLSILSKGPVAAGGRISGGSDTSIDVASTDGDIDIEGASFTTDDTPTEAYGPPSGSIHVQSYRLGGTIDATGATLTSGSSRSLSGSVRILVRGEIPTVESFMLPTAIVARWNGRHPERSVLAAKGFLDTGPLAVDLGGPATVRVGERTIDVPSPTVRGAGAMYVYAGEGLSMSIRPSKSGSSRARFRLRSRGAFRGAGDPDGPVTLGFKSGTADANATVRFDRGVYASGGRRGAILAPSLSLAKSTAVLHADWTDVFSLTTGFAEIGAAPDRAPDVSISFGDLFIAAVPGASFTRSGDVFTSTDGAIGVASIVVDYVRGTVSVDVKSVNLGDISTGDTGLAPVFVGVSLGSDRRGVNVRMRRERDGKTLTY